MKVLPSAAQVPPMAPSSAGEASRVEGAPVQNAAGNAPEAKDTGVLDIFDKKPKVDLGRPISEQVDAIHRQQECSHPSQGGLQKEMANAIEARKGHLQKADALGEQIAQAQRELNKTTPLLDWNKRTEISDRIKSLKGAQQAHDSMADSYGKDIARMSDILYPNSPALSERLSPEAAGRREESKLKWLNTMFGAIVGPSAGPALASRFFGASEETIAKGMAVGVASEVLGMPERRKP